MLDPRSTSPGSNMPNYPWLYEQETDVAALPTKVSVLRLLGVPFAENTDEEIQESVDSQAIGIAKQLREAGVYVAPEKEIVALIAYLQSLGAFTETEPKQGA